MKTNNAPEAIAIPQSMINILMRGFLLMMLGLYTFTLFASPNPAKLSSFTATIEQHKVTLQWSANDEKNVSHYMIQRSTNGDEYSDMACLFTEEASSSIQENKYQDKVSSIAGIFYYRLKIVLTDGSFTYSEVKTVKF